MAIHTPGLNANGQRFWMLSTLDDWLPPWRPGTPYLAGQGLVDPNGNLQTVQTAGISDAAQPVWTATAGGTTTDASITWVNGGSDASQAGLSYCNGSRRLQLRSQRTGAAPQEDFAIATTLLNTVPMTLDVYGNHARWDAANNAVVAGGSGPSGALPPDEVPIYRPPNASVTDIAMGYDGILYLAAGGALILADQRNRWSPFTLDVPDFRFWRLVAWPDGGVIALDSAGAQMARVGGAPLRDGPADVPNAGVLQPCQTNENPPRILDRRALHGTGHAVALAPLDVTQRPLRIALLSWGSNDPANDAAYLSVFDGIMPAGSRLRLSGVRLPYGVAGLGGVKLAVLATNLNEALVYSLENVDLGLVETAETLVPAGETFILAGSNTGPMAHGFDLPPRYANPTATPPLQPLIPLSLNSMAANGATNPAAPAILDSGMAQNAWHRLFVEAVVPPRSGAIVWLAASDALADFGAQTLDWYPHVLGDADVSAIGAVLADAPRVVWQPMATEVPFGPSLLGDAAAAGDHTRGLFMALVQRANKAVRTLSGRFLGVRIQLNADGRNTPEIAALRIYGPRFSYVQNYLPQIYREDTFGPEAGVDGPSTRRDFFERFVNLFEDQFTRMEDRIANAYLVTRSDATPVDALPWLGGWIGAGDDGYPPDRLRDRLAATPRLHRRRGTADGITDALDVATGGMCRRGAIIVIEDFRLRHTFATILGADLSDRSDPLLPGYSGSSNSLVGDTLFLGDPGMQAELQALYARQLDLPGSGPAVQAFYDALALQLTVFVHDQVENVNLNLVLRIVEAEKPAHVRAALRRATAPFMVGLASLLGVNTYLGPQPIRGTAALDVSAVGRYDVIRHLPSLDPRLENGT